MTVGGVASAEVGHARTSWPRVRLGPAALPVVVAAVATVVGALELLRRQPLSWDEAVTVAVATRPVSSIALTVHHTDAVLGLYYVLVHAWGVVVSDAGARLTDSWWRVPSVAAAVGTCVLASLIARRLAGARAGLVAGGFLAVTPLFGFYAVDARPYTLAALAVTGAWWVWTGRGNPLLRATLTVLLLVVGAWLQLFTVLVWPSFALVAFASSHGGGRSPVRRTAVVVATAAVAVAPLGWIALHQNAEVAWIPAATLVDTARVGLHVAGGAGVLAVGVVLVALALRARLVGRGPLTAAVAWWVVGPFACLAAADVVHPVLVARYALVATPMAAVAVGVVVARSRGRSARRAVHVVAAGLLVAAAVTTLLQGLRPWKYEDYRGAAAYATSTAPAGTMVLFAPASARLGFLRYASPTALRDLTLPAGVGADPLAIVEVAPTLLPELTGAQCEVVVVGDPLTAEPSAADRGKLELVSAWHVLAARGFGAVTVTLVRNPRCDRASPTGG